MKGVPLDFRYPDALGVRFGYPVASQRLGTVLSGKVND